MANYKLARNEQEILDYLDGAEVVGFDFETAPDNEYRSDPMAAIDPHKAYIVGVSFSREEGSGIYAPIAHKDTNLNLDMTDILCNFAQCSMIKVAHNLSFETMFLYKQNILTKKNQKKTKKLCFFYMILYKRWHVSFEFLITIFKTLNSYDASSK